MMRGRVTVVQLIYGFGLESYGGGAERFALALSETLDPSRFRVMVCGLWSKDKQSEHVRIETLRERGIPAVTLSSWNPQREAVSFYDALRGLRAYLRKERVDILHSHSQFADIAALLVSLGDPRLSLVRTPHDGHEVEWRQRPWRRRLFPHLLYPILYDAEIGVSHSIVSRLNGRSWARRLGRTAIHIPNAIDLERFARVSVCAAEKRQELGLPPDAFVLGSVGRLSVEKGFDLLLEATRSILKELPQTRLLLIGGGDLHDDLVRRAAELGIADHVRFTGPRSDVEELLPCIDLFVSSSRWEGLSTVILESMASGTPVVATAVGGVGEILTDGHNGWLSPPADPSALADTILRAYHARSSWRAVRERALKTVMSFSIDAVARQHEELYVRLLGRTRSARSITNPE